MTMAMMMMIAKPPEISWGALLCTKSPTPRAYGIARIVGGSLEDSLR
jgi:hypothetical protein